MSEVEDLKRKLDEATSINYKLKTKLKKAVCFLNSVDLAFIESHQIEELTFKRDKPPDDYEMIKIFLSSRDERSIHSFLEQTWEYLKERPNPAREDHAEDCGSGTCNICNGKAIKAIRDTCDHDYESDGGLCLKCGQQGGKY